MICALLNRELGRLCRSALTFLDRSVSGAMGCFFGCFRVKDDRHLPRSRPPLVSQSSRNNHPEIVVSQNRLSSLFSAAEEKEGSPSKNRASTCYDSPQIDKDLRNEAKFLKACGTLAETPVEIRKASSKFNGSLHHGSDSEPPKFNSWLPNSSIKKLQQEDQLEQPPTPIKLGEDWGKGSGPSELMPGSCVSNQQNTRGISISSAEGSGIGTDSTFKSHSNRTESIATPDVQCRSKAVRFECDIDTNSSRGSSSENYVRSSKFAETPGKQSISKPSVYPTPLTLSEEMQTPGTVFPANLENFPNGRVRIRSQYVYSVQNPVEGISQWKVLNDENSNSHGLSGESRESVDHSDHATPVSEGAVKGTSSGQEYNVESSLSAWLKPVSNQDENNRNFGFVPGRTRHFGRTPGDRPIIGLVATHWNEEDATRVSPKWWDGNGIPNSTNKYKEDQKVSWHATPFEERLEKALSEESFISQRKNIEGKPIVFDENDETDTALSQLQSSSQPKSVVSF